MLRSFGIVELKVQETDFFMYHVRSCAERSALMPLAFYLSAFVAAARSITFALRASLNELPGFAEWYGMEQEKLKQDPLARYFRDARTASQKVGAFLVGGGISRNGKPLHFFRALEGQPDTPSLDVVSACEQYYVALLTLVFRCVLRFRPEVDGQHRYTEKYFTLVGKTIEDAEEELGLPRHWTDVPGIAVTERWRLLRGQADGCEIEAYFQKWLGKSLSDESADSSSA